MSGSAGECPMAFTAALSVLEVGGMVGAARVSAPPPPGVAPELPPVGPLPLDAAPRPEPVSPSVGAPRSREVAMASSTERSGPDSRCSLVAAAGLSGTDPGPPRWP